MQNECSGEIDMLVFKDTVVGEQGYNELQAAEDDDQVMGRIYLPVVYEEQSSVGCWYI